MFSTQHPAVKVELVRRALAAVGSGEGDLTQEHFLRILQLAEQNVSGRKVLLPAGFAVLRDYGKMVFIRDEKTLKPDEQAGKSIKVEVPGLTRFGQYSIEATISEFEEGAVEKFKLQKNEFVERFDLDKMKLPLMVRFRKAGDRFWPLGLAGEKKVGKFLTAAKVQQELRRKLLIVADSEKVIWVWPIRISEQAKVTSETRKILQLEINNRG